jgi:HK97 family phage portal protein
LLNSADNTWPYKSLVMQPDSNKSLSDFLKRTAVCLSTQGNAFWRIYANSAGLPKQVEVLNPLQVLVRYSDTGVKFYDYNGYANRGTVTLKDSEVKHLRLMEVPNRVLGLGPIEAGRDTIRALLDLQDYQATFLSDGGVPNGLLSTDEDLDSELAGKYQSKWYENLKVGKTAVLGRGVKYQALTVNPQEALFTEQVTAGITAVARVFGIPAHLLIAAVEGNSMTYMNLVTSDTVFVRYGLKEYLTAIEDAFSELLPRGTSVRLLTDEWLRGDDRSRSDVATKNLTSGVWTINEARAYTGKSPIANGDALAPQTSATTTEGDAQAA